MTLCISFFSCTNLLYIYKMGMKSLFVQLDNSVVIAFITDHTAKSGILQVLTNNQWIHVLHAVIFHLQNIKKEINALYSLKKFCKKRGEMSFWHQQGHTLSMLFFCLLKDLLKKCRTPVLSIALLKQHLKMEQDQIWWKNLSTDSDRMTVEEYRNILTIWQSDFLYTNEQHTLGLLPHTSGFPALDLGGLSPTHSPSVGCWRSSRRCHVLWLR